MPRFCIGGQNWHESWPHEVGVKGACDRDDGMDIKWLPSTQPSVWEQSVAAFVEPNAAK